MVRREEDEDALQRHYALLDIMLILFWFMLTGEIIAVLTMQDISLFSVAAGIIAASLVTYTAHEFVIRGENRKKGSLSEYLKALRNLVALLFDVSFKLIVANGVLLYQSLTMDIKPRIVRVKVDLTSESEVTLISLLISLVPGTLVMDVEEKGGSYYLFVHYSYLKAEDLSDSIKETITGWDRMIQGVFK